MTSYFDKNPHELTELETGGRQLTSIPEDKDEEMKYITDVKTKEERIPDVFRKLFFMESVHDINKYNT